MDESKPHKIPVGDPVFVSLGMAVLDELRFANGKVLEDVLGGSCIYSTFEDEPDNRLPDWYAR